MTKADRNKKILAMADGSRSSCDIAAAMNVTRNVVIGLVQRARKAGINDVKLPPVGRRRNPGEMFSAEKPKRHRRGGQSQVLRLGQQNKQTAPDRTPLREAAIAPRGSMVCAGIPDAGLCRYIHGGNPQIGQGVWCAHPVSGDRGLGRSYCHLHRELCVRRGLT